MHFHRLAINLLAYGEKQWFIYPPHHPRASYSALTTTATWVENNDWFRNHTPMTITSEQCNDAEAERSVYAFATGEDQADDVHNAAPMRLVQRAGDIVVVPEEWAHSTLNTQPSIGVAHEVRSKSLLKHRYI